MNNLDRLLSFDPLAEAERVTRNSYKDDKGTMALGFLMHLDHGVEKRDALKAADDSWFNMNLADTLDLYRRMGFVEVLCDEFTGRTYSGEPAPTETFRILWHDKGILATVESHGGTRRNATKVYYNVAVTSPDWYQHISSGHLAGANDRKVWVGDHDAREGVRHNLAQLEGVGDFLPVWVERPFLWLLTYMDTDVDGCDYKAINAERIGRLPQHVQDAIGGAA